MGKEARRPARVGQIGGGGAPARRRAEETSSSGSLRNARSLSNVRVNLRASQTKASETSSPQDARHVQRSLSWTGVVRGSRARRAEILSTKLARHVPEEPLHGAGTAKDVDGGRRRVPWNHGFETRNAVPAVGEDPEPEVGALTR